MQRKSPAARWILPTERKGNRSDGRLLGSGRRGGRGGPSRPAAPTAPTRSEQALDLAALVALEEPARDGRVARGQRTRRNVAEALMELLRAGDTDPTAKAVARRAGVSLRLVFHHFADMDDLYQFVAALQLRRQWADMPQLSPGSRWRPGSNGRWRTGPPSSRRPPRSGAPWCAGPRPLPPSRQALAAADDLFLEDLKATFAAELDGLPASSRAEYLGAMDTGTSWEAWERSAHHVGRPGTRRPAGDVPHAREALSPAPGRRTCRRSPRLDADGFVVSRRAPRPCAGAPRRHAGAG